MRKMQRLNPKNARKKDPGVPNLWPYKEALLNRMDDAKKRSNDLEQQQKLERRQKLMQRRTAAAESESDEKISQSTNQINNGGINHKKWYMKDLKQVLEVSDVILEVLDARDPLGCRCRKIEEMIQSQYSTTTTRAKKIILVLNKIDLVPAEVIQNWIAYLRREFACVAFKANTQHQKGKLGSSNVSVMDASSDMLQGGGSLGGGALLQLIKNYSRSHDIKTAITVGVIGYPNVGKSSLINSLKRARAVGVGAQPGFTKQCQLVKLDKQVSIIDSPGVLFDADTEDVGLSLRNCLKVEDIADPVSAVKEIHNRAGKSILLSLYRISNFNNADEFLYRVAQKRGKLAKGGIPDMAAAARVVLRDWNSGKIPFYTLPPKTDSSHDSVAIVSEFSKEFDLDKANEDTIKSFAGAQGSSYMQMETKTNDAKGDAESEPMFITEK